MTQVENRSANLLVTYEATPNPNSMKFNIGKMVASDSIYFDDPTKTARSPLAEKLFGFAWVQAVLVGPNFVTITKQSWVEWQRLAEPLSELIAEHIERGEGILVELQATPKAGPNDLTPEDSIEVARIKEILNNEIRPAVAVDGGDVLFDRYENNRLYIQMMGACSGCPSSTITLKQGIEARIKKALPEVIEVISV